MGQVFAFKARETSGLVIYLISKLPCCLKLKTVFGKYKIYMSLVLQYSVSQIYIHRESCYKSEKGPFSFSVIKYLAVLTIIYYSPGP